MIKLLGVALVAFMLTACAGQMSTVTVTEHVDGTRVTQTTNVNNSDTAAYYGSVKAHSEAEERRVVGMSEHMMKPSGAQDPEARAWENAFKSAMMAFGDNFKPTQYSGEKNKTWIDVAEKAVPVIGSFMNTATMAGGGVAIADKLLDREVGNTINMGDGGTVDGSFNTEKHESTAKTLYGDASVNNVDNSVKEEIPAEEPEEEEEEELECSETCSPESELDGICIPCEDEE